MTTTITFRRLDAGLTDRLGDFVKTLRTRRAKHRVYRQTLTELQALSDRELADLGLTRAMLRGLAMDAAYGKTEA